MEKTLQNSNKSRVQRTQARKKERKKEKKKDRETAEFPTRFVRVKRGFARRESCVNRGEHAFARNFNPSRAFFTHASHSRTTATTTSRRDYAYVRGDSPAECERANTREYRRDRPPRYDASAARVNALYSPMIASRLLYDQQGQDATWIQHLTRHLVVLSEISRPVSSSCRYSSTRFLREFFFPSRSI